MKTIIAMMVLLVGGLVVTPGAKGVAGGFDNAEDRISRDFEVSPGGRLTVDTENGSIEVRSGDSNTVSVEVIRKASAGSRDDANRLLQSMHVDFNQSGNDVRVEGKSQGRGRKHMEFRIRVPRSYNVDLTTSGGSVSVAELQGDVRSRTSGGSLSYSHIEGPVQGKTSGGSISVDNVRGNVDIDTSGGSISVNDVDGDIDGHTSGGSVSVERVSGHATVETSGGGLHIADVSGAVDASTSGGSVEARFPKQLEADCRLTTSGGGVTVYLVEDIRINIDAEVNGGHIETDFPVTVAGKLSKSALKGSINGGGPMLYCRSSGSSISLRRL